MTVAKNAQTTVAEILTTVKEELFFTDTTRWDFRLKNLIRDIYAEICSEDVVIQIVETATICDAAATLPASFVMFNKSGGIRFGERPENCNDNNYYTNGSYWLQPIFTGDAFNNDGRWGDDRCFTTAQIRGKQLIFNPEITWEEVHLSFDGLRLNADGTFFIPAEFKRVIVAGVCYSFIRSAKHLTGHGADQMNDYKLTWSNGKKWAEGQSRLPDALMRQAINRIWNSYV